MKILHSGLFGAFQNGAHEGAWACRSSLTCLACVQSVYPLDAQVRTKFGQAGQMSASEDVPQVGLAGDVKEAEDGAAAAADGRMDDSASHTGEGGGRIVDRYQHRSGADM